MKATDQLALSMSEATLQYNVTGAMDLFGWRWFHAHDSRRSNPGFPDIVAVRGRRILFVELKSEKGRVRPEQKSWAYDLFQAGAETYTWRPSDWLENRVTEALR